MKVDSYIPPRPQHQAALTAELRDQLQTTLGSGYTLDRELGGGGMSRVFVARETALGRSVVVKVLLPELAAGVSVDRFRREIQLAAQLQHACIVPLLSAGVSDGLPFYTMPLVEGESLRARLARDRELPVNEVIRIVRDVAGALSYAHEHGVVHRDIKPDNVLLTKHHALVTDFGVAKALSESTNPGSSLTSLGVALGTPAYMSPEQASADPQVDHRADLYALGAMAYEMLAGQQLFAARSPQAMLAAHATEVPVPVTSRRPAIPPGLAELVMKCLEKRAADRPNTAENVVQALDALATPSGGMEPTGAALSPKRKTRSTRAVAVTAALLVVVAGATALILTRRAPRNPKQMAVLPLENKTGDPALDALGRNVAERLTRGLTETGVVEMAGAVGDAAAAKRAGTLVSGTLYRRGDSLEFTATLTDGTSGAVLRSVGPLRAPAAAPDAAIEQLTQRVMGGVAMMFDESYGNQGTTVGQPPTYAAYREYSVGEGYFYQFSDDSAIAHFRGAVALDSTFRFPLIRIATALANARRPAQEDSVLKTIEERRGSLSPFEGYYVDALRAELHGDLAGRYAATQQMSRAAPKSDFASYWRAIGARDTGRWQEVVEILEKLNPESGMLRGRVFYYEYLTFAFHRLNDHTRELAAARKGRQQYPDRLGPREYEVCALAALGKVDEVNARISESLTLVRERDNSPATVMLGAVRELRAHGNPDAAKPVLQTLFSWLESRAPAEARTEAIRWERAQALELGDRWAEAQALADSLSSEHPENVGYLGARGIIAARQGNRAEAERISTALAVLDRPFLRGAHTFQRAGIAAVLGDKQRAVQLLADAIAQGYSDNHLRDFDTNLESLRDYPPYEQLRKPKQ
ncbi:MAG: protein kinase [Gemmatimonadales bacterium]|jgi:serine/threonine-protein kinase